MCSDFNGSAKLLSHTGLTSFYFLRPTFARIVDGNGDSFSVIDMGAYEFNPAGDALPGDYNEDDVVDAADYVVWRKHLGQTNIPPFSLTDGDGDGDVTQNDYNIWRSNFGNMLAPGAGSSTATVSAEVSATPQAPEPTTNSSEPVPIPEAVDLALANWPTTSVALDVAGSNNALALRGVTNHSETFDLLLLLAARRRDTMVSSDVIGRGGPGNLLSVGQTWGELQEIDDLIAELGKGFVVSGSACGIGQFALSSRAHLPD